MQKFTIRPVVLKHKVNSKGITSIKIAVTVNRQVTYMSTGHSIHLDQWDGSQVVGHPNAKLINVSLKREMAEIEKRLITNSLQQIQLSKKVIKGQATVTKMFKQYATEVKYDKTRMKRIIDFGGEQLMLSEINVEWLRKFQAWCVAKGFAQNTLNTTFKYLGRIIKQAKKEKYIQENPFDEFDKPKYIQTDRIYLVQDEINKMVALLDQPMSESFYNTLCHFLLGCFTGLRHSDWGRYNGKAEDGLVKHTAKKNKRHVVVPIGKTLDRVLKLLEDQPAPFSNQKCNVYLKCLASMAGIDKEISTHTARHSFGCLCASLGLPESTTAKLMGINAQTVKVYYHLTGSDLSEQAKALKEI